MKIKPLLLTSAISSMLVMAPTLMANESNLKVAIIKNAALSSEVADGEYSEIIANLSNPQNASKYSNFEKNTALCVAYLKTSNKVDSEAACTAAIESTKLDSTDYLKSISYSNRAVARYLKNDIAGAMSDLSIAKSIDSNKISRTNLEIMNSKFEQSDYSESVSLAD